MKCLLNSLCKGCPRGTSKPDGDLKVGRPGRTSLSQLWRTWKRTTSRQGNWNFVRRQERTMERCFGGRELFLFVIPTNFGNLANRSDKNVLWTAPESTPKEQINKHSETDLQPITLFFFKTSTETKKYYFQSRNPKTNKQTKKRHKYHMLMVSSTCTLGSSVLNKAFSLPLAITGHMFHFNK